MRVSLRELKDFFAIKKRSTIKTYFRGISESPCKFFLIIAVVLGTVFVLTNPPGFGLDERAHFARTYLISKGDFIPNILLTGKAGAYLPDNLGQFMHDSTINLLTADESAFFWDRHDANTALYTKYFQNPFSNQTNSDDAVNVQLLAAEQYSPLGYIPMAIPTKIVQLLNAPMLYALYASRFVSLIIYILLVICAIKITPKYKWLFVFIALLPTALFQASTMSLDPLVNGFSFVVIAYALRFWLGKEKSIRAKDALFVLASFLVIALIKPPYLCLGLMYIFLPRSKFLSEKNSYVWKTLWVSLSGIAVLTWAYLNRYVMPQTSLTNGERGADIAGQLHFIQGHLVGTFATIFKTYYVGIDTFVSQALGTIGDRKVGLPPIIDFIFFSLILILIMFYYADTKKPKHSDDSAKLFNLSLFSTLLAFSIVLPLSIYITYTPVGWPLIDGVQGRYYIPVLAVLMIALSRVLPFIVSVKSANRAVAQVSSIVFLVSTMILYLIVNY